VDFDPLILGLAVAIAYSSGSTDGFFTEVSHLCMWLLHALV
jgi:hypothetical protein